MKHQTDRQSAFSAIPGLTEQIFPSEFISYLTLVVIIGLILFLFIVGLKIETEVVKCNVKYSISIVMGSMVVPFSFRAILTILISLTRTFPLHTLCSSLMLYTLSLPFPAYAISSQNATLLIWLSESPFSLLVLVITYLVGINDELHLTLGQQQVVFHMLWALKMW